MAAAISLPAGQAPAGSSITSVDDSLPGAAPRDLINDFSVADGDRIDLSAIDANPALAGDQAFTFIGTAAFSGVAGEVRYAPGPTVASVFADLNDDRTADFQVVFNGAVALNAGSFVL